MEPVVTEELIARQPPEAQAVIRVLLAKLAELEAELRKLRGLRSGNASLVGMCRELHERRQWLWAFVHTEGVRTDGAFPDPTVTFAEK